MDKLEGIRKALEEETKAKMSLLIQKRELTQAEAREYLSLRGGEKKVTEKEIEATLNLKLSTLHEKLQELQSIVWLTSNQVELARWELCLSLGSKGNLPLDF